MGGERGRLQARTGALGGEAAAQARWRKSVLTWKLGAWVLRPFNGSAPK